MPSVRAAVIIAWIIKFGVEGMGAPDLGFSWPPLFLEKMTINESNENMGG
jgi:hypothetical protein